MTKQVYGRNKKVTEKMELRERIIEEATRMFAEDGIKSVRMDDIASACGISKRTLYETFADRQDLIKQSLLYHHDKYEQLVFERLEKAENVMEELWIIFGHSADFREKNNRVVKDLIKFYPDILSDFMKTHHVQIVENNRDRFERGQKEGFILSYIDSEFMAQNLTNYIYGMSREFEHFTSQEEKSGSPIQVAFNRTPPFATMLFFRGMATEKGRQYIDEKILRFDEAHNIITIR